MSGMPVDSIAIVLTQPISPPYQMPLGLTPRKGPYRAGETVSVTHAVARALINAGFASPSGEAPPVLPDSSLVTVAELKARLAALAAGVGAETIERFPVAGAAITLGDLQTTGTMKDVSLTAANCVITLPPPAQGTSFLCLLRQDAAGGRTATFVLPGGGTPEWGASGMPPALTASPGAKDEITWHTWDDLTWTGALGNKDIR